MPSTLTHVALQTPLFVTLFGRSAWPWALLGCVLADVGWILQRAFKLAWPGEQLVFYDVRLAAVAWSSLLATLLLSAALAVWARRAGRAFLLLSLGATAHLALDAVQLRWGNGVHFALPLQWQAWSPGKLPPDHAAWHVLALVGLTGLVLRARPSEWDQELVLGGKRLAISVLLLASYVLAPIGLRERLAAADVHSVETLRSSARAGLDVELYRAHYFPATADEGAFFLTMVSEPLTVVSGFESPRRERVSIKARFVSDDAVEVLAAHVHPNSRRSALSVVGLIVLGGLLMTWVRRELYPGEAGDGSSVPRSRS